MNNTLNTPSAVYAEYLTAVEAYEVGGPRAQVLWMQGRAEAKAARRVEAASLAFCVAGAAAILAVTLTACLA